MPTNRNTKRNTKEQTKRKQGLTPAYWNMSMSVCPRCDNVNSARLQTVQQEKVSRKTICWDRQVIWFCLKPLQNVLHTIITTHNIWWRWIFKIKLSAVCCQTRQCYNHTFWIKFDLSERMICCSSPVAHCAVKCAVNICGAVQLEVTISVRREAAQNLFHRKFLEHLNVVYPVTWYTIAP